MSMLMELEDLLILSSRDLFEALQWLPCLWSYVLVCSTSWYAPKLGFTLGGGGILWIVLALTGTHFLALCSSPLLGHVHFCPPPPPSEVN